MENPVNYDTQKKRINTKQKPIEVLVVYNM